MWEDVLVGTLYKGALVPCRLQAVQAGGDGLCCRGSGSSACSHVSKQVAAVPSPDTLDSCWWRHTMPTHCRAGHDPPGVADPAWEGRAKVRLRERISSSPPATPFLAGGACLLFELTRPLGNLFLESELQEALEEQESWMWPGLLCAYG